MSLIRGMAERWSMHHGPCHVRFLAPRSTSLKPCPTTNVQRECLPSVSCCTRFHARIAGVRSPLPSWAECLLSFHRRNASFAIRIRSTMPLVPGQGIFSARTWILNRRRLSLVEFRTSRSDVAAIKVYFL